MVAGNKKGHLPQNPEELRSRLGLLGRCWLFLRTKHTNRPYLLDLAPQSLVEYADYILSKDVVGLRIGDKEMGRQERPTWSSVLKFEMECRKVAYKRVRTEGVTMAVALREVRHDPTHRQVHFTAEFLLELSQQLAVQRAPGPAAIDRAASGRHSREDDSKRKRGANKTEGKAARFDN